MTALPDPPAEDAADRGGIDYLATCPPSRRHVLAAWLVVVVVYAAGVAGDWWPTSDGALYLGLGRRIAEGRSYSFNGRVCNSVTPGYPLILAGLRLAFGPGYWAPNALAALCGLGALAIAYRVLGSFGPRRLALAAALACAAAYTFYRTSHHILTDAPFLLLFWAVVWASRRAARSPAYLPVLALAAAAALFVRAPGVVFLCPWAVGMLLDRPADGRARQFLAGGSLLLAALATTAAFYLWARAVSDDQALYVTAAAEAVKRPAPEALLRYGRTLAGVPRLFAHEPNSGSQTHHHVHAVANDADQLGQPAKRPPQILRRLEHRFDGWDRVPHHLGEVFERSLGFVALGELLHPAGYKVDAFADDGHHGL